MQIGVTSKTVLDHLYSLLPQEGGTLLVKFSVVKESRALNVTPAEFNRCLVYLEGKGLISGGTDYNPSATEENETKTVLTSAGIDFAERKI